MNFDPQKIDLIIQYSLLVAGEEDEYLSRQLGPIHLIKYVYLADLFYAAAHKGKTFTEVNWQFYNFGPWSQVVHSRIDPALKAIMANKLNFESDYGDADCVRWHLRNGQLFAEKSGQLPISIILKLRKDIHEYLKDTPSLLDYVYKTKPMLNAAPNDRLDFSTTCNGLDNREKKTGDLKIQSLSNKKQRKFKDKMASLREAFQKRKTEQSILISPVKHPRYDEVFSDGINWLESLAGVPFSSKTIVAKFSPEVWASKTRKSEDVP